jgi:hypothetical protein
VDQLGALVLRVLRPQREGVAVEALGRSERVEGLSAVSGVRERGAGLVDDRSEVASGDA